MVMGQPDEHMFITFGVTSLKGKLKHAPLLQSRMRITVYGWTNVEFKSIEPGRQMVQVKFIARG